MNDANRRTPSGGRNPKPEGARKPPPPPAPPPKRERLVDTRDLYGTLLFEDEQERQELIAKYLERISTSLELIQSNLSFFLRENMKRWP